ncbi:PVC-type heme-binding CxxCH protein [Verrucomicrobiota bacterium sgz303538]
MRPSVSPLAVAIALLLPLSLIAEPVGGDKLDDRPSKGAPRSDTADSALKGFSVAPGLQAEVWAAEPLLANPVALTFDDKGRAFVAETYRRRSSVPDIRKNTDWVIQNLALRTTAEREAFLKKAYAPEKGLKPDKDHPDHNNDGAFDWRDLEIESERIRLIEDRDGNGKADTASVYAEGFNELTTGVAAGVLAQGDDVWFTCIPELWHLHGSGTTAPQREALAGGFGVHVAYSGHDMHGIKLGPDGKVYWSIADCGAHVTTKEGKVIDVPDCGAVFRANPDGSEMELYAWGLRNPQSLAFNELGDLFTGDNNADGGDKARWEHIVEGGDYGWRIGWQFLPKLGAWNSEKLWELNCGETALSLLPPVGHIGHGPAGIAYYPGTGLPDTYRGHFFYADFPGGVRSFAIKPKGASYTVDNPKDVLQDNTPKQMTGKVLWSLYPSDVAFGVDGGLYVLDWIQGWEKTGKGRIFRVQDPAVSKSEAVLSTKKLLGEGMKGRTNEELAKLLNHVDQRVRLAAQWELAGRSETATLTDVALQGQARVGRLHAIWGLGQIARKNPASLDGFARQLLRGSDPEVCAQTAKIISEAHAREYVPDLIKLLESPESRVQFFAASALARLESREAVPALIELLRRNSDRDAYVRHAAVFALSRCADAKALTEFANDSSDAVRAGVLLALRRLGSPEITRFLADKNAQIVIEAVRAAHDQSIDSAMPQIAELTATPNLPATVSRRAINAAYRLGSSKTATTLANLASNSGAIESVRLDALEALGQWNQDLGRDRVLGLWRPLPAGRDPQAAGLEVARILPSLLKDGSRALQLAAAEVATSLKLESGETTLTSAALDAKLDGKTRAAILRALASFNSPKLANILRTVLTEKDKTLLEEARRLTVKFSPSDAVEQTVIALENGSVREKQSALQTLAELATPEADKLIASWLDRYVDGKVPAAIQLDLLEAATKRTDVTVKQKLAAIEANRNSSSPIARWSECLEGGDAKIGREIFNEKAEAACMRCHKLSGVGGDVGPDLAGFGAKHDRNYILTSIISPNAMIAQGYENTLITLNDGTLIAGIISAEDANELTITPLAGGEKTKVQKGKIKQLDKVPSAMPEGLGDVLGKRDLRNVVEFLAGLK